MPSSTASATPRTALPSTARPCANHRKTPASVENLTTTPPSEPLKWSTAAAVRDHRNAVRDRSERCPQSIGITVRIRRNPHRDDARQRVAVIGIARQRLHVGDELAALAVLEGGGNADLDAELVGPVRLAFADALHLGSVQAVDLGTALPTLLVAHSQRQAQQRCELRFEPGITFDLAGNVPDDAAHVGVELAQSPVGAVELASMGVTLMPNELELADPRVRLAQLHAELFGQLH